MRKILCIKTLNFLGYFLLFLPSSNANIWHIGYSQTYTMPSAVVNLVANGDTIYIDGGVYANDAVKWTKKDLKFIGLGTGANPTILQYTGNIPNGKGIWVFDQPGTSDNPYIENITFSGAQVSDGNGGNGAGIRHQSVNLTVNGCKFFYCQNGILEGGSYSGSTVVLENCEFAYNGYNGSTTALYGYEHHIYISANTDSLLVTNCYFHDVRGQGNSLKTRAQKSYILYNLIDEANGDGSWELNIAQGGLLVVMGNTIIQGTSGANHGIIGWDATTNAVEELYFVNNTVINKYVGNIKFVNVAPSSGINVFKLYNNIFASTTGASNTIFTGNVPVVIDTSNNLFVSNYNNIDFINTAADNFNLQPADTLATDKGTNAGFASNGFALTPLYMYQSDSVFLMPRSTIGNSIDIGAYENSFITGMESESSIALAAYPNPFMNYCTIDIANTNVDGAINFHLYNYAGQEVLLKQNISPQFKLYRNRLVSGMYLYELEREGRIINRGKLIAQ